MTQAVPHGYQDWNRQTPTGDTQFVNDNTTIVSQKNYGPFFVGIYGALGVTFHSSSGIALLDFQYFADAAMTQPCGNDAAVVGSVGDFRTHLQIRGPFVQVSVQALAGNVSYFLFLYSAHQPGIQMDVKDANFLIQGSGTAIAASGSARVRASRTWPGEVVWVVTSTVTGWSAILEYQDELGADNPLDHFFQSVSGGRCAQSVFSPAAPLSILVINGASAGTFYIFATGRPAMVQAG